MARDKLPETVDQDCQDVCITFFKEPRHFDILHKVSQKIGEYAKASFRLLQFCCKRDLTALLRKPKGMVLPELRYSENKEADLTYWRCEFYTRAICKWGKRNFETYRSEGRVIQVTSGDTTVKTTISQMNFVRVIIQTGALDFIVRNIDYFRDLKRHIEHKRTRSSSTVSPSDCSFQIDTVVYPTGTGTGGDTAEEVEQVTRKTQDLTIDNNDNDTVVAAASESPSQQLVHFDPVDISFLHRKCVFLGVTSPIHCLLFVPCRLKALGVKTCHFKLDR